MGARIGRRVMVYPDVWIVPIDDRLTIGDDVDISRGVMITPGGGVEIGPRTLLGYGAKILSVNHRLPADGGRIFGAGHTSAPINIGNDCWIGANVVILPGVSIGQGSVIAAGAVVTKNVPEWSVVAGVPARVVRSRLTDDSTLGYRDS